MFSGRPLVLASTSPGRRALLDRLRLPYEAVAPDVDEHALVGVDAEETATLRAIAKARSVASTRPDAVVIGADQVVDLDGELLGKPGSPEGARAQLARLAGRVHRLVTAVAIVARDLARPEVAVDVHRMSMRALDDAEIRRYVAADDPEGCAGSYKVESLGITLFDRIEGGDWTGIVGLPLLTLCSMLRRLGAGRSGGGHEAGGWALP
jgi:septum formation protein